MSANERENTAEHRHKVLADVGAVLAAPLDIDLRLKRLADTLVPSVAEICLIDIGDDEGVRRSALRTVDPEAEEALRAIRSHLPGHLPAPIVAAMEAGETAHLARIDDRVLAGLAEDEEHLELLRRLKLRSGAVVPILTPDGPLGAIAVGLASPGRSYDRSAVTMLEAVGRRAGLAVENALLHRRLARQERRFRSIFEESVDGMMLVALDGRILAANPAICQLLDYTEEELLGGERASIVDEDDPAYRRLLRERLEQGRSQGQLELIRKDGERVPVEITSAAVRGPGGEDYSAVIVRDVRERRRRRIELQRREWELETVLEHTPDVVTRYDRQLRATYMNPAIEAITGVAPEAFLGRRVGESTMSPELARRWEALLERVFETGEPQDMEFTFPGEEGPRRFLARVVPELGGGGEGGAVASVLAVSREISALRSAQERVRFQARLLDAVGEAVIATDLDGTILYWNRAAEDLYGWSEEEVVGRKILEVTPAAAIREAGDEIIDAVRRGETWAGEFTVRRKDGTEIPVFVTDAPIVDEEGRVTGIVGVSQDMSEQHRLEEKLRHAQKMQAIGRLAGGVAHDFNNVLTVIRGHAQLILSELDGDAPLRDDLEEVLHAADRGASLTGQLLAFSRKQMLQPGLLDVGRVVEEIVPMLGRLIGEDVDLETRCRGEAGPVLADRSQLEQVLMNLAVNARDAMPSGGRLTLEVGGVDVGPEVAHRYEGVEPGPFVVLAVSDTGVGIPADVVEHIFDPFFTTKEQGKGTGLGLSTVYGVIRQSGGFVTVYSEPGEGTTFRVYLPRRIDGDGADRVPGEGTPDVDAVGPGPAATEPGIPGGDETVLVVDDDEEVRGLARRVLEEGGYTVLEASSGAEALDRLSLSASGVDLLVTDLVMPSIGGVDLVSRLREAHPGIRGVLTSGFTEDRVAEGPLEEEGHAFLAKPFTPRALLKTVRRVLDRDERAPREGPAGGPAR